MYQDLSDPDLVQRCLAGSQAAWATLVRRYQRLVYTVPLRAGLSDDEAADVFQTTFLRLHEHLARIDDPSRLRAWLVTTAKREALKQLQYNSRFARVAADSDPDEDPVAQLADPSPLPPELLVELQDHDRLRQAVDLLNPRARQFVELLFLQDEPLSYQEIAHRLHIAEGSIGPTRARVLEKLRALLKTI